MNNSSPLSCWVALFTSLWKEKVINKRKMLLFCFLAWIAWHQKITLNIVLLFHHAISSVVFLLPLSSGTPPRERTCWNRYISRIIPWQLIIWTTRWYYENAKNKQLKETRVVSGMAQQCYWSFILCRNNIAIQVSPNVCSRMAIKQPSSDYSRHSIVYCQSKGKLKQLKALTYLFPAYK